MKIIDFYKKVLTSLNINVTKDGFLKLAMSDGSSEVLTSEGKAIVLPTREHINSYLVENEETGKIEVSKILYNPLNEDVINGDTLSLRKTKDLVERRAAHSLIGAGSLLLRLAKNEKVQKDTSMAINKFLMRLSEADNPGIKNIVDDASIEKWEKIYQNSFKQNVDIVKIFIKKKSTYKGKTYNRLATTKFPVYDMLKEVEKNEGVLGVKLRNKDITVFKILYEYLLDLSEDSKISIGSSDGESPGFIALFRSFLIIVKKSQMVLKTLKALDQETYDSARLPIKVKESELDTIAIFKPDLLVLPSEIDVNRRRLTNDNANTAILPTVNNSANNTIIAPTNTAMPQQQATQVAPAQEMSLADKILYGNGVNDYRPPIVPMTTIEEIHQRQAQPHQYLPQNGIGMPTANVVPAGVNTVMNQQNAVQHYMQQANMFPNNQMNNMNMNMNNQQMNYNQGFRQQAVPMGANSFMR